MNRPRGRPRKYPAIEVPKTLPLDEPKLREEKDISELYPDLQVDQPLLLEFSHEPLYESTLDLQLPKELIIGNHVHKHENIEAKSPVYHKVPYDVQELFPGYVVDKKYKSYGYGGSQRTDMSSISFYLGDFCSEYDMDEQDMLYVLHLQERYPIDNELFEILMTVLEIEWQLLEKKIPPAHAIENNNKGPAGRVEFELYGSDDGIFGDSVDQPCAICNVAECNNSNAIVFCDGCDIAVHQECYGVIFIPEGQWLCRKCQLSKNGAVSCEFCPSITGAFKQLDSGLWGHVLCGLWIPELTFANSSYMEPIEGYSNIPKSRWKLVCYICKQPGACIQCVKSTCVTAYHVTCARRAGLYMDLEHGVVHCATERTGMVSYCDKHQPREWPDVRPGIRKARAYFEKLAHERGNISGSNNEVEIRSGKRWLTARDTPIAPQLFANIVKRILLEKFGIASDTLCYEIVKYWSMKRELKRGAPLIRKEDSFFYGSLNREEIPERLQFAQGLLSDIEMLTDIVDKVCQRQETKLQLHENLSEIINLSHDTVMSLARPLIAKISDTECFRRMGYRLQPVLSQTFDTAQALLCALEESVKCSDDDDLPTRRLLQKLWSLLQQALKPIQNVSRQDILHDFTVQNFVNINLKPYMGREAMKEEELSEVEDDNWPPYTLPKRRRRR